MVLSNRFKTPDDYKPEAEVAETVNLAVAQDNMEYARTLGLKGVVEAYREIFPDDWAQRDAFVIGNGPSNTQKNPQGQTLLEEVDGREGFKALGSMGVRLLTKLKNDADIAVFGSFNSKRITALREGGHELIKRISESRIKLLLPTYVQPKVFKHFLEAELGGKNAGLGDQIYLWEPYVEGLETAPELGPAFFAGSTGPNAAYSLLTAMGAQKVEMYGVDTSGRGQYMGPNPFTDNEIPGKSIVALVEELDLSQDEVAIEVGDHLFSAKEIFWKTQTLEFERFRRESTPSVQFKFHGNHVNEAILNAKGPVRARVWSKDSKGSAKILNEFNFEM